jgi:hypothetical protein
MTVKLLRRSTIWTFGPSSRLQKALDEQGIVYLVVKGPARLATCYDLQRLSVRAASVPISVSLVGDGADLDG